MAYDWEPKNEYWLERSICEKDEMEIFNLMIHEMSECEIMRKHFFGYEKAHGKANILENAVRHCDCKRDNTRSASGMKLSLLTAAECIFPKEAEEVCRKYFRKSFGEWLKEKADSISEIMDEGIMSEKVEKKYHVAPSPVHGWGAFASKKLSKSEFIGLGFITVNDTGVMDDDYEMTELSRGINHSSEPNCNLTKEHGNYYFRAAKNIDEGKELLVDYKQIPFKDFRDFIEKLQKG
jgi:hypothetical protein